MKVDMFWKQRSCNDLNQKREHVGAHDLSCGRWFPNGLGKKGFDGQPQLLLCEESEHAYIISKVKSMRDDIQKETLEISIDRKAITNLKNGFAYI